MVIGVVGGLIAVGMGFVLMDSAYNDVFEWRVGLASLLIGMVAVTGGVSLGIYSAHNQITTTVRAECANFPETPLVVHAKRWITEPSWESHIQAHADRKYCDWTGVYWLRGTRVEVDEAR